MPGHQRSPKTQIQYLYVSENKSNGQKSVLRGDQKKFSPVFLPLRKLSQRPRCRRVSQRSGPVCTSSLNCRWPPAVPLGSPPVSLHLLCLSPCGPTPTEGTALYNCLCTMYLCGSGTDGSTVYAQNSKRYKLKVTHTHKLQ